VEILFSVRSKADNSVHNLRHALTGRLVVGRVPDCALPLDGTGISREHLAFEHEDSGLFITDLSTNGTWINGKRVPTGRRCKVRDGDSIEVPGYEIRYQILNGASGVSARTVAVKSETAVQSMLPPESNADKRASLRSQTSFLSSFTGLEKFLMLIDLLCFGLLLVYLNL
jgi:predicted component of type VI protein secretion system